MMVKNAGDILEKVLLENMDIIDRWTILDTGSTDNTIEIIKKVLNNKKGNLYQEPFINFRDSRNRCLELSGNSCAYTIMLDDTYVVKGDLRKFLNEIRGDQYADSFSFIIKSDDSEYSSNRIIKSEKNLRYIFKIHEVIQEKDNVNVIIPKDDCYIFDYRNDYMEKRTMDRKQLDLKLLYEMVEEEPHNPRHYYYLAQTYNLLNDYQKAVYYFEKRFQHSIEGFLQEKIDAVFECARIHNFKLNSPWEFCEKLYKKAYKLDKERPESLYFIGIHYHLENNNKLAFKYFKKAFNIGFPLHRQYSLKPTLSFHFLPKFLTQLCYEFNDYILGEKCAELFLKNNDIKSDYYDVIQSWYNIFLLLNKLPKDNIPKCPNKPIFVFLADGGFKNWTGSDILKEGVGGSETYIIELARYIQKHNIFDVYVFCRCNKQEIFENVIYRPIDEYINFISSTYIYTVIISRFSEYLPVTYKSYVENIHLVLHDLSPSGCVLLNNPKLKNIFCLTEWHVEYFSNVFPTLKHLAKPFYYGVDFNNFYNNNITKIPRKFIYSSFPNRGLLPLLNIWPRIIHKYPDASLYIYCNLDHEWSNSFYPDEMKLLREIISQNIKGVNYIGWVSKKELAESFLSSDIWLYPCKFQETFCLTALEAAITKTLAITTDLAALQNTVSDRGIMISGDPMSKEWQDKCFEEICKICDDNVYKNKFIQKNYEWALNLSWENRANILLNEYILPHNIEYKNIHGWNCNLPSGSTQIFLNILNSIKNSCKKVLEIGTHTGTSIIHILNNLNQDTKAVVIDNWKNYNQENFENGVNLSQNIENLQIEKSFYKNIKLANLNHRITAFKDNSQNVLFDFFENNQKFDLIYLNGDHNSFTMYLDAIISWKLLNINGILIIDDYYLNFKNNNESLYESITYFINNLDKNTYKLIDITYRIFIKKIK
jgi:predicted O-methyltransferase YrrM